MWRSFSDTARVGNYPANVLTNGPSIQRHDTKMPATALSTPPVVIVIVAVTVTVTVTTHID